MSAQVNFASGSSSEGSKQGRADRTAWNDTWLHSLRVGRTWKHRGSLGSGVDQIAAVVQPCECSPDSSGSLCR